MPFLLLIMFGYNVGDQKKEIFLYSSLKIGLGCIYVYVVYTCFIQFDTGKFWSFVVIILSYNVIYVLVNLKDMFFQNCEATRTKGFVYSVLGKTYALCFSGTMVPICSKNKET